MINELKELVSVFLLWYLDPVFLGGKGDDSTGIVMLGQVEIPTENVTQKVPISDPFLSICPYKSVVVPVTDLTLHFSHQQIEALPFPLFLCSIPYYPGLPLWVKTIYFNCRSKIHLYPLSIISTCGKNASNKISFIITLSNCNKTFKVIIIVVVYFFTETSL